MKMITLHFLNQDTVGTCWARKKKSFSKLSLSLSTILLQIQFSRNSEWRDREELSTFSERFRVKECINVVPSTRPQKTLIFIGFPHIQPTFTKPLIFTGLHSFAPSAVSKLFWNVRHKCSAPALTQRGSCIYGRKPAAGSEKEVVVVVGPHVLHLCFSHSTMTARLYRLVSDSVSYPFWS